MSAGKSTAKQTEKMLPDFRPVAEVPDRVMLTTHDGQCPSYVFKPLGAGPWPAIMFLMDGFGMRRNITEMAQRLADGGYLVLLPDLFYRRGRYPEVDVGKAFATGNLREAVRSILGDSPTVAMVLSDAPAFLNFLRAQPDVAKGKIGVTGYCMSGGMSLAIAGSNPDEIGAAACFHGGLLVSDSETSPHRFVSSIKGEVYVGGAETDEWCPPEMVAEIGRTLAAAKIVHRCEIYEGTKHGWTMRDSPLYNESAAERHWRELFALFERALGGKNG